MREACGLVSRTKTTINAALFHPVRRRIADLITEHPGARLTALCRVAGTSRRNATYHLGVLERNGIIAAFRTTRMSRYFPRQTGNESAASVAALLRGRAWELARLVRDEPGLMQKDLTSRLNMSRKIFRIYATTLQAHVIIEEKKQGRSRFYFAAARLETVAPLLQGNASPAAAV